MKEFQHSSGHSTQKKHTELTSHNYNCFFLRSLIMSTYKCFPPWSVTWLNGAAQDNITTSLQWKFMVCRAYYYCYCCYRPLIQSGNLCFVEAALTSCSGFELILVCRPTSTQPAGVEGEEGAEGGGEGGGAGSVPE